ncbi:MAG: hypothetical protein R2697_02030 [Ilumatobacteraceae bacterium]
MRSLDDAEIIALLSGTVIMVCGRVAPHGVGRRRAAGTSWCLEWLGPVAVAPIIPGPSDMPAGYKMFVSRGYDNNTAGTAVAPAGSSTSG